MAPDEAIRVWREWASDALAPLEISVHEPSQFAARWRSRSVGPLQLLELEASPQSVAHCGAGARRSAERSFQLVYSRRASLETRLGGQQFTVAPGDFVLLDNSRPYEMAMTEPHTAIDLVMPQAWLARWLPDPAASVGISFSASDGWGAPLGCFLQTLADNLAMAKLPRAHMADQLGSLIALATGGGDQGAIRHRDRLAQRILHCIGQCHADPDFDIEMLTRELGISKRYVHALMAETGTSFGRALNRVRLDRAADMLRDPACAGLQVGQVAWRCGFVDAGYFARLFRRHFGLSPREWRNCRDS